MLAFIFSWVVHIIKFLLCTVILFYSFILFVSTVCIGCGIVLLQLLFFKQIKKKKMFLKKHKIETLVSFSFNKYFVHIDQSIAELVSGKWCPYSLETV